VQYEFSIILGSGTHRLLATPAEGNVPRLFVSELRAYDIDI